MTCRSQSHRDLAPPTSTMADGDRLSDLSDDLLRRILFFAPAKEAASTSVLSRRWRWLWRFSGSVNLETRVHDDNLCYSRRSDRNDDAFFSRRDSFVSAAEAALAAAADPVTRLTFHVEADYDETIYKFLHGNRDWDWLARRDVVADVLSHPAARRVEELRLALVSSVSRMSFDDEVRSLQVGVYALSLGSLPSESLRVLDLTNCSVLKPPAAVAFPLLASLRLSHCAVPLEQIQGVIDASPALATVHLEYVLLARTDDALTVRYYDYQQPPEERVLRLRCSAATALVLDKCGWTLQNPGLGATAALDTAALEIDAPRLRRFRYMGYLRQFSLSSQAPDLARVDLHFLPDRDYQRDKDLCRVLFWRFVQNFSNAKELKLKVNYLEDIAVVGEKRRAELLCAFRDLERLELAGAHKLKTKTAAVAIANLLRCCPAVRDLTLKLNTVPIDSYKDDQYVSCFLARKYRDDFDKSMDHFMRRRSEPMVSLEGDGDDDVYYDEVSDIPGLSGHLFGCLQSCLRRVGLQFRLQKSNCFGVRLVKFFAENAMVLEEMCIDDGNAKMCEHMNRKVERWIANSSQPCSKRKNSTGNSQEFCGNQYSPSKIARRSLGSTRSSETCFTVSPLER